MSSTKALQETIYNEIVGRLKEDDESYPTFQNGYYYYSRTEQGKQYRTYCRRKGSMEAPEEIIFNLNEMAEGKSAFIFRGYSISPDNSMAAYFYNETGSSAEFTLKIKELFEKRWDFPLTVPLQWLGQTTIRPYFMASPMKPCALI